MNGICGCTIGPPPWPQRCMACGAYSGNPAGWPGAPLGGTYAPLPPSAEDIRRIVREELERHLRKPAAEA